MNQELTVISASHALVPVSDARCAAMDAIAAVEDRRWGGRRLSGQPFARASSRSLLRAGIMWEPRNRLTSIIDYEHVLNVLLESRGLHCPLPLSGCVRQQLFPEYCFARDDHREKKRVLSMHTAARREASLAAQEYMLLQGPTGEAAAELNVCTPVTASAWYNRWESELPEELLEGAFWRWLKRFPSLCLLKKLEGMGIPLWSAIDDLTETNSRTSGWLYALEAHYGMFRLYKCSEQGDFLFQNGHIKFLL